MTILVNARCVVTDNFLYNGTTYIPLRSCFEAAGAEVTYNGITKTVNIIEKRQHMVSLLYHTRQIEKYCSYLTNSYLLSMSFMNQNYNNNETIESLNSSLLTNETWFEDLRNTGELLLGKDYNDILLQAAEVFIAHKGMAINCIQYLETGETECFNSYLDYGEQLIANYTKMVLKIDKLFDTTFNASETINKSPY